MEYYWKHRDDILAAKATPEHNAKRRARYANDVEFRKKRNADTRRTRWKVPEDEMAAFLAMYDEECFYCGCEGGAVDHLTPRKLGGEDRLYNLVPCCIKCNSSKNSHTLEQWYGLEIRRSERKEPPVGQ